jgi:hypothetical protein
MVELAIRKTLQAELAASRLGFSDTSKNLRILRQKLLNLKGLGEDRKLIGAHFVEAQVEETQSVYLRDAESCDSRMHKLFEGHMRKAFRIAHTLSFLSVSCSVLSMLESMARDHKPALAVNSVLTMVTLCLSYIVLPAMQAAFFQAMVKDSVKRINEAIQECKKLAGEIQPNSPN